VATVSLRNTSGEPLYIGSPEQGGRLVDKDEVVKVDGKKASDQPGDAIVIGEGDDARAYPKSLWSEVSSKEND
jgi:hypothetical protein